MPEVWEHFNSRKTTLGPGGSSSERDFIIQGAEDEEEAIEALVAFASAEGAFGLDRQDAGVDPIGPDLWYGSVTYGLPSKNKQEKETGDYEITFDTGGATQHITQSLGTPGKFAAEGGVAPDFQSAIGVSGPPNDRKVEGTDIVIPNLTFTRTHYLSNAQVTPSYVKTLARLTGKKNAAPFASFAAGEVLFLGASGSKRAEADWQVAFHFAASENLANLLVGGITVTSKPGWDYMWVWYEAYEDTTLKMLLQRPRFVYVETVHEDGDFSLMGIGG